MKGNVGEWSEFYVLLRLLADGKLFVADADLNKLPDVWSPLLRVFRQEVNNEQIEYRINDKKHEVELYINGDKIKTIPSGWIDTAAMELYQGISSGGTNKGSFAISNADQIMDEMHCSKIKAKSENKADIQMQMYDSNIGISQMCGFSIKSNLGASPTLFNASAHSNFIYEVRGLSDTDIDEINSISTKRKIIDRMDEITKRGGKFRFVAIDSDVFTDNISFIDIMMDDILGNMLLLYYRNMGTDLTDVVTLVEQQDPLGCGCSGLYRYKMKKFLAAVALGMTPGTRWAGQDEANGGYIVVKDGGEVVAYHLYNRDNFETYLLNNTKFEKPSTSRYDYAYLYKRDNKVFIKLNMQIRFK